MTTMYPGRKEPAGILYKIRATAAGRQALYSWRVRHAVPGHDLRRVRQGVHASPPRAERVFAGPSLTQGTAMRFINTIVVGCTVPGRVGELAEHQSWDDHPWTREEVDDFMARRESEGEWVYHSHRSEPDA